MNKKRTFRFERIMIRLISIIDYITINVHREKGQNTMYVVC